MNTREAMKVVIKLLLDDVMEHKGIEPLNENSIQKLVEQLHDDTNFIERMSESVEDFLNDFGENYGL